GIFADGDHLADHRRKDFALFERLGDGFTLTDADAAFHDRLLDDLVAGRDGEAVENRYAGAQKHGHVLRETRDGDFPDQVADDRQPEHPSIDYQLAFFGFIPQADGDDDGDHAGYQVEKVLAEPVADINGDLRRRGKRLAHAAVELSEYRDNVYEQDRNDGDRDDDD